MSASPCDSLSQACNDKPWASIEGFDEDRGRQRPLALFAWDREIPDHTVDYGVQVRLKDFELHRPRHL